MAAMTLGAVRVMKLANRSAQDRIVSGDFSDLEATLEKAVRDSRELRRALRSIEENDALRLMVDDGLMERLLPLMRTSGGVSGEAAGAKGGDGQSAVDAGNSQRQKLGHYAGGMFYFEGEWYWGVDRLRLLEARLAEEGLAAASTGILVPEPIPADTTSLDTSKVLLEYFPSLRSPYTAIGHQRVLDLIDRSGVPVEVRPVMPMLMRGVPAPRAKQRYIITDAAREGIAHGSPTSREARASSAAVQAAAARSRPSATTASAS